MAAMTQASLFNRLSGMTVVMTQIEHRQKIKNHYEEILGKSFCYPAIGL